MGKDPVGWCQRIIAVVAVIDAPTLMAQTQRTVKAIQFGKPMLMRDDWKRVFEPSEIAASIRRIT